MPEFDSTIEYRDIPGFPGYKVGNDGTVWSCRTHGKGGFRAEWRQLNYKPTPFGRSVIRLCPGRVQVFVHRLVLEAFVGPCPPKMEACHGDDHPLNNHVGNLRWDTHKANVADAIRNGRARRGERVYNAYLTEDIVREIRRAREAGETYSSIGAKFGITIFHVREIVKRRCWKHIA